MVFVAIIAIMTPTNQPPAAINAPNARLRVPQPHRAELHDWLDRLEEAAQPMPAFAVVSSHTPPSADAKYTLTAAVPPSWPVAEVMEMTLRSMFHELGRECRLWLSLTDTQAA